tara:strand:- start:982 stop:1659 length:678 start_codon:yes stop_codon:yes gene_type:complete
MPTQEPVGGPIAPDAPSAESIDTLPGICTANRLFDAMEPASHTWSLDTLAGRFVEITSRCTPTFLTSAAALILEAQQRGELAAWIGDTESIFFPPDFVASGIDLAALPVIRVSQPNKAAMAADALLRSGGFTLIILDVSQLGRLRVGTQTRLSGLARKHHTALLYLTRNERGSPSLGSLVSIRGEIDKQRSGFNRFTCELQVIKDKRTGPGWGYVEVCRGPHGLC